MNGHLGVHTVFKLPALEDIRTNCDVKGGVGLHQDSVSADTQKDKVTRQSQNNIHVLFC